MIFRNLSVRTIALFAAFLCAASTGSASAGTAPPGFQTLFSFAGGKGGAGPRAGLTALGGKLYGTTVGGGAKGAGTVFGFDPAINGFDVLHAFRDTPDGNQPYAGLTAAGTTLYGTTLQGGKTGLGSLFGIDTASGAYQVLFNFNKAATGTPFVPYHPAGDLAVLDGILYGTASAGGSNDTSCNGPFYFGCGAVFMTDPITRKSFIEVEFKNSAQGANPTAGLTAHDGSLYGTTLYGGAHGGGTVFRLTPNVNWGTLHSFTGVGGEGDRPNGDLVPVGGMLYGTTLYGGTTRVCGMMPSVCGTIFRINPKTGALATVHVFNVKDGVTPVGLAVSKGILYGCTYSGGRPGWGTIFSLDPATGTLTTLYNFPGGSGGKHPVGAPVWLAGSFYGVTSSGGTADQGTIFRFTP
jgi:uncharacterized repeat protein (TIGR03803 family)